MHPLPSTHAHALLACLAARQRSCHPCKPPASLLSCRRTCALLLQLCAAAEAAAGAGEPLASQVEAAWSGGTDGPQGRLPHLMGTLLEACGGMEKGTQVQLGGSLQQGLVS